MNDCYVVLLYGAMLLGTLISFAGVFYGGFKFGQFLYEKVCK